MGKIILLSPEVSRKIAAGEVIERPFSVVKELVENSLDAGAAEIRVDLLNGGKKLIRVQDNGCGMSREDALLCFERHSTSKIAGEADLDGIKTLGFRGEALASVSVVSRMVLRTHDGEDSQGTEVEIEGGRLVHVRDIAFPQGTSVEADDLFYNVPARQKFLRSDQSELGHIAKYVTTAALAYPQIRFILFHGKREIFDYHRVETLKERIFQVFGKSLLERLAGVDFEEQGIRVSGYASRPPSGRRDRTQQLFYVNRRPVRDRLLQAALNQAYRGLLEKDLFPEAVLFLSLPFAELDVNVHPAKAEVRFRDSVMIFHMILRAVGEAVLREKGIKELYPMQEEKAGAAVVGEAGVMFHSAMPWSAASPRDEFLFVRDVAQERAYPHVLGQYLGVYIIAADAEGLLVIDQHNAHERVLFEKYRETREKGAWPRRMPLLPLLVELSPSQVVSLEESRAFLEESGFGVEPMGGRSYALKEFPDIFDEEEARRAFLSLLEEMKEGGVEGKRDRVLATLACRTAVKAGESLAPERLTYLVEELFRTSNPSLCPHGRPVLVRVEKSRIEKELKRSENRR